MFSSQTIIWLSPMIRSFPFARKKTTRQPGPESRHTPRSPYRPYPGASGERADRILLKGFIKLFSPIYIGSVAEGSSHCFTHRNGLCGFTVHLSDLFSSVAIERGSMESGCRFANGITGRSAAPDAPG